MNYIRQMRGRREERLGGTWKVGIETRELTKRGARTRHGYPVWRSKDPSRSDAKKRPLEDSGSSPQWPVQVLGLRSER